MSEQPSKDSKLGLTDLEESLVFFAGLSNNACSQLTKAAAEVENDDLGHQLLATARAHLKLYEDEEKQFDLDHFFNCLDSLENLLKYMSQIGSGAEKGLLQVQHLRDYFELNRYELGAYLLKAKKEYVTDMMRENYWMN